ncbi:hypothetical protein BDN72DRAFT_837044 [Pluteus cervinus]|uniref:Uncharacterized protein n=1 Tax=Pluteus cervinus TaxID=181527 RepID=A0ACD3B1Y0_9AGAR|nr:hypothetical protein BDN72DRAFT_837044 [Pluteus cervinus]
MALTRFPGLQLDTLSVHDGYHGPLVSGDPRGDSATGQELEDILLISRWWKELRYSRPDRVFLDTWAKNRPESARPKEWDEVLKKRDRKNSGASVKILVARERRT